MLVRLREYKFHRTYRVHRRPERVVLLWRLKEVNLGQNTRGCLPDAHRVGQGSERKDLDVGAVDELLVGECVV